MDSRRPGPLSYEVALRRRSRSAKEENQGWSQEGITPGQEITGMRLIAWVDRLGRFAVFGVTRDLCLPLVAR